MILKELINKFGFDIDYNALKKAEQRFGKMQKKFENIGKSATKLGKSFSLKFTAPLALAGFGLLRSFDKQAKAVEQVRIGLESTGNQAGKTLEELKRNASKLQEETLFGDEEILSGATAQLLTFTNIAGEQFDRTQKAVLDLATRLAAAKGGAVDLTSASIQLGKALNDPVANLGALGRSGIQFSDEQKELIKTLFQTGKQAEAQNLLLTELERQYGGSAKAAAEAGTGGITQMRMALGDLGEKFGAILNDILKPFVKMLRSLIKWFDGLSKTTKKVIVVIGALLAITGPVLLAVGKIAIGISFLIPLMAKFAALFGVAGNAALWFYAKLLLIPLAIIAIVAAIWLIVDDIQGFLSGKDSVFGKFILLLDEAFSALAEKFKSFGSIGRGVITALLTPLRILINTIKTAVDLFNLISGDISGSQFLKNVGQNLNNTFGLNTMDSLSGAMGFGNSDESPVAGLARRAQMNRAVNATEVKQEANLNVNVQGLPPETAKEVAQSSITNALGGLLKDTARSSRLAIER